MKKTILALAAMMLMLVGCTTNDEPANVQSERIVTFGVTLPDDAQTRAYYTTVGEGDTPGLRMMWKSGDKLSLAFVGSDGTKISKTANIIDSNINGNKASFTTSIPSALEGKSFTVYAVFFNNKGSFYLEYLSDSDTKLCFKRDEGDQSLLGLDNISPVVYAVQKDVTTIGDFSLQHIGWVMALKLVNASDTDMVFDENNTATQFTFGTTGDDFSYNEHGWEFDLETASVTPQSKGNRIYFDYKGNTVKAGESVTLYRYMVTDLQVPLLICSAYFNNGWHFGDHKYKEGDDSYDLPAATVKNGHVYYVTATWKGDFNLYIE
jgi:hypothetical protein